LGDTGRVGDQKGIVKEIVGLLEMSWTLDGMQGGLKG
jgi:hypothetical protein